MKKLLALLLALCLTLPAVSALAEAASNVVDIDFGDFTIPLDPATPGSMEEKVSGQVMMTIYPVYLINGDGSSNFNASWDDVTVDIAAMSMIDVKQNVDDFIDSVLKGLAEVNLIVSDFELLDYGKTEVDGLTGMYLLISYTADYSNLGEQYKGFTSPLVQKCVIVSGSFGAYSFTATSTDMDTLNQYLDPIYDTIRWN